MLVQIKTILFLGRDIYNVLRAEKSLRFVLNQASHKFSQNKDTFAKAFIVTGNRILLDSRAIRLLVLMGYYGSAISLVAASLRTRNMIAALHVKSKLIDDFNDEDKWTHADSNAFKNKFNETTLKEIISNHFGEQYIKKNSQKEIEQVLHGSSYALKRWYSRILKINGLRTPTFNFSSFFSIVNGKTALSIAESIDIELVGIFFEHYQEEYPSNMICSCGSGKKYKECHGKSKTETGQ